MLDKLKKFIFAEDDEEEYVVYEESRKKEEKTVSLEDIHEIVKEEKITVSKKEAENNTTMGKINVDIEVEPVVEEKKVKLKPIKKEDYNYTIQPVISPFFGSSEVEVTHEETGKVITKPAVKKEKYNHVISPIYGINEVKPIAVLHNEKKEENFKFSTINPILEEDVDNIALDEIVSIQDIGQDDLVQCSLFGEEQPLVQSSFENDEVQSVTDDTLPF